MFAIQEIRYLLGKEMNISSSGKLSDKSIRKSFPDGLQQMILPRNSGTCSRSHHKLRTSSKIAFQRERLECYHFYDIIRLCIMEIHISEKRIKMYWKVFECTFMELTSSKNRLSACDLLINKLIISKFTVSVRWPRTN